MSSSEIWILTPMVMEKIDPKYDKITKCQYLGVVTPRVYPNLKKCYGGSIGGLEHYINLKKILALWQDNRQIIDVKI